MWIDSHCHLDFPDFADEGIAALVERARLNRVGAMLTISTHTARIGRYTEIADQFENVWTTIGVHPHQANEEGERDITTTELVKMANSHPKIVAIGECGLDYHYDYAPRDQQHKVFREHINAAIETGLPIIIHSREADDDMIKILSEVEGKGLTGVLHCFTGTQKLADYAVKIGFCISFSGIVTFPKSQAIQEVCKTIPLKNILIETDAPYLAPDPYRGKRNEPSFVTHTGLYISKLHQKDENETMRHTTDNFYRLFNKINGGSHAKL